MPCHHDPAGFLFWPGLDPIARFSQGSYRPVLTVGLMLVPQGVAYAALAGMPLVTGIYASLLPGLVAQCSGVRPPAWAWAPQR